MKTPSIKKAKGLTLIELTVVIVVLLGLISVLFISARAWIEGSNRAKCIVNMSTIQKAAVSYANLNNLDGSDTDQITLANLQSRNMIPANLAGTGACPGNGDSYTLTPSASGNQLDQDTVWVTCTGTDGGAHVLTLN